MGSDRGALRRDVLWGLGVFVLMAAVFWTAPALAALVTGGAQAYPPGATSPPVWVLLYTTFVLPFTLAPAEEMVYRAYGSAPFGVAHRKGMERDARHGVCLRHGAPRHTPGGGRRHLGGALPDSVRGRGLLLQVLYLRLGRLVPLIVAHGLIVAAFLGGLPLFFALR